MKLLSSICLLILCMTLPGCGMPAGAEWMWIAGIALLLFGGSKLPSLLGGLGKGMHEFKKGIKEGDVDSDDKDSDDNDSDDNESKEEE
jgi:sec-independent protein translocase protein TatA